MNSPRTKRGSTQVVRPELANQLRKKAEDLGLLALGLQ